MNANRILCVVATLGLSVLGCASRPSPQAQPQTSAPAAATSRAARDDSPTLVVRGEVVRACPQLRALRDGSQSVPADVAWVAILYDLAGCMQTGDLRGRTIELRGTRPARDLVAGVLTRLGVTADRLSDMPPAQVSETGVVISLAPEDGRATS